MMLIGMILFAAAVVVAAAVMTQNRNAVLDVHAFGYHWSAHAGWLVALGIGLAVVAGAGVWLMQRSALRAAWRKTAAERAASPAPDALEPAARAVPPASTATDWQTPVARR